VDAVLAAAAAQWVVNAPLCGPGGDLFVMHTEAGRTTVYGGWSRTPRAITARGDLPTSGPRSIPVPGALAGMHAAWAGAGRLPWARIFDAALEFAGGHEVTGWMAGSYAGVVSKGHGEAMAQVLDQGPTPRAGEIVSSRRLAASLQQIAVNGADDFYRGDLGGRIAAAAQDAGAFLSAQDLQAMDGTAESAITHDLDGIQIAVPGPPSQAGIMPRLLEAIGAEHAAESIAFAEATAPVTERELVERCVVGVPGTAASAATDGTTSAVVVHSLAGVQFGSGWVAGDTGIAFGNRVGTALSKRADLPAANPVPGGVLPHTLSAAALRCGDRSLLVATPGGDRQVQWLAQCAQRFRRGEHLERVVSGPRWFVCPEGDRFGVPAGIGQEWFLFAEPGIEWFDREHLAGYKVRRVDSVGGGVQCAARTPEGWQVGSDLRAGGAALDVEGRPDV
jgi:gamma-glutamyltranspeptidase/glutathione hydrolase